MNFNLRWMRDRVAKSRTGPGCATQEGKDELLEIIDRHLRGESTRVEFQQELSCSTADAIVREGAVLGLFSQRLVGSFLEYRASAGSGSAMLEKTAEVRSGAEQFALWYTHERERCFELIGMVEKMLSLGHRPRARALVDLLDELGRKYRELDFVWWPVDFDAHRGKYPTQRLPEWLEHEKARLDTQLIRLEGGAQDEIPF